MSKTLLTTSKNILFKRIFNVSLKITFVLMLLLTSVQNTTAQCIGPYQNVESFPIFAVEADAFNDMTLKGWIFENLTTGTGTGFTRNTSGTYTRSGIYSFRQLVNNNNARMTSPVINTPSTFAFWIKKASAVSTYVFEVSDDNGATWYPLVNGANSLFGSTLNAVVPVMSTTWQQVSVTGTIGANNAFPVSASGYRFRITDNRVISPATNGIIAIDDFSWKSSVTNQNTTILPYTDTTSSCPFTIQDGITYTFYDNGGNDTYSNNQLQNDIILTPANVASKIKIEFEEFNIRVAAGYGLGVFNSNNYTSLLGAYNGNTLPPDVVSSAADGSLSFQMRSAAIAAGFVNTGFKIKVTAVQCNNPSVFAGTAGSSSANLTWVGSGAATNYEIFQATSATPVPVFGSVGTLTGSTTPSYIATGLTPGTNYYFWVRSICGSDKSAWVGPVLVKPICNPINVPYLEDFNGFASGTLPPCTSSIAAGAWGCNAVNGNIFTNTEGADFFTKGVTLTAGTIYRIYYDYRNVNITVNPVTGLEVFIGTTNTTPTAANIVNSLAYHNTTIFYQTETLNYTAPTTGTYYLRFLLDYTSDPSVALNVDNIRIEEETCFRPNFGAGNSNMSPYVVFPAAPDSDYGATISWNTPASGQPANGYLYYLSTSNTPPSINDLPTGSVPFNTNSVTFNTLTQNTSYYFWIRSNCGGQTSLWSVYHAYFTTTNINVNVEVLISDVEPTPGAPGLNYQAGCNFTFFESGGSTGNYVNFEDHTYTFRPAVVGRKLKVVFSSFNTENNYDGLMIYSGDDSPGNTRQLMSSGRAAGTDPINCPAGAYSGTTSPGTIISNAANGSLSFTFKSDYLIVRPGWSATITCVLVPSITSFTPANNSCGTASVLVTLTGTNFTGVTGVTFGGVPAASFTVVSATQITATVPATAITGKIRVIKPDAFVDSATNFVVQLPSPTTTPLSICIGGTGDLLATSGCNSAPTNTITGAITASNPSINRPNGGTTCSLSTFAGTNAYYTATQFTVTVSGTYAFQTNNPGTDFFGYITTGPFVPGSCATGTLILANDDGAGALQPLLSVNLTTGTVYTLYTTTYANGVTGAYNWSIATPIGGGIIITGLGVMQWYTAATGGTSIFTGSNFNPVGVAGSGVLNNTTPVNLNFYAACSSNPTCRTATNYTIVNTIPGTASSDQNVCLGSAADVVLAGNGAPVTRWQYNATDITFATGTTVNIAASASTTLTSAQIGTFSGTRYYRAEITVGSCTSYSNAVTITFSSATWNGSAWSNGTGPTASIGAIFNGNYSSTGNLNTCSVVVNSGNIIFNTGHTLTVQNTVNVVGGTLTFDDESSLYQPNAVVNAPGVYSGGNTGNIVYSRTAEPMFREDYSYWSSPVYPQNLLAVSTGSPQNYFLTYNGTSWVYVTPSSTTMSVARGYLVRAPLSFNLFPGTALSHTANFSGVPNNGSQSIPVVGGSGQVNLLGNPYPSAISAYPISGFPNTGFVTANTNLSGSLYFWTHNTNFGVYAWGQYNPNDYAIYNYSGGSTAGPMGSGNNTVPNGLIASGQGFFVEGLSSGTATFTNAMRRATGNDNFYRTNQASQSVENNLEKHRYWLEVTNDSYGFKQVLIGYIEGATNGLDRLYDAKMVDYSNQVSIYTKIDNTKLTIQGKELAFDVNEIIPLCFEALTSSNFTIKLSDFDGLFLNQNIYLEDTTLNIIHDLKQSPYTFASTNGLFESRFKVRYTTNALGVNDPVFNENSVVVYKVDQEVHINSGSVNMKNVTIFDIAGRLITSKLNVNDVTISFDNLPQAQQVLLVKIESENGAVVTKKVVY